MDKDKLLLDVEDRICEMVIDDINFEGIMSSMDNYLEDAFDFVMDRYKGEIGSEGIEELYNYVLKEINLEDLKDNIIEQVETMENPSKQYGVRNKDFL